MIEPTEYFHVVETGLTLILHNRGWMGTGTVVQRGQTYPMPDTNVRLSNTDRTGWCPFDILNDDAEQIRRWGKVYLRPGKFPAYEKPWRIGDQQWMAERRAAMSVARLLPIDQQEAAVRAVHREYGSDTPVQTVNIPHDEHGHRVPRDGVMHD